MPSRAWAPLLLPLKLLDLAFRFLARSRPTTVVGADLAERYGRSERTLEMHVTLLGRDQLAASASSADWSGPIRLLTVGRIEPEKNPLLLVDVLAALERSDPGRFSLTWIGDGRMLDRLRSAPTE